MRSNNELKICSLLLSCIFLKNPQIAQFLVPQFSRKYCHWKIVSVYVWYMLGCVCMCCTVHLFVFVFVCSVTEAARSRIDAKGQQFVGVQVVEGAQVWQAQEKLGEEGGVIWATASDQ